ncbi:MAG: NAD(P)-binding domain-containing protein [Dehalococcoidia bacterium]
MIIGLIGLGEMGSEIGRSFVKNKINVISVFEGRSKNSKERAMKYGIKDALSVQNFSKESDIVISVIPPDKALETAKLYSSFANKENQIYCDLNAISTMTAKKIKKLLDQRNLNYVDGSIMGGPPNEKYSPRVYLSGKLAKKILFLSGKGIEIITLTGSDFQASAMKMVYASITKGSKALVAGAFIVAKKNDVFQELIEELEYSEEYFHNVALKQVPSIKHKAYRWIGEMNEISSTFKDSGLTGGFHSESEKIYELIKDLPSGKFSFDEIILKITDKMKE